MHFALVCSLEGSINLLPDTSLCFEAEPLACMHFVFEKYKAPHNKSVGRRREALGFARGDEGNTPWLSFDPLRAFSSLVSSVRLEARPLVVRSALTGGNN